MNILKSLFALLLFTPIIAAAQQEQIIRMLPESTQVVSLPAVLQADQAGWFALSGAIDAQPEIWDQNGDPLPFNVITPAEGITWLEVIAEGEYFLRLNATGGYLRAAFSTTPPQLPPSATYSTPLLEPAAPRFIENFDDNVRGWWTGEKRNANATLANGIYTMQLFEQSNLLAGFTNIPGANRPNFLAQARVSIDGDTRATSFGLALRMTDGANFYLAQVSPQRGAWRFAHLHESNWEPQGDWQPDPRLQDVVGAHTLGVWALGDVYFLVWDEVLLGHVTHTTLQQGAGLGLFAEVVGAGAPILDWESLTVLVEPDGIAWAAPPLDASPTLTLDTLLVGEWYWNDDADTQAMSLIFGADGFFLQTVIDLTSGATPIEQRGTWYTEGAGVLVLQLPGLPDQRYTPAIDPVSRVMSVPELGNRVFVRTTAD